VLINIRNVETLKYQQDDCVYLNISRVYFLKKFPKKKKTSKKFVGNRLKDITYIRTNYKDQLF